MAAVYDNWERLVTATLRREELRLTALRTPSDVSSASLLSGSPSLSFSSQTGQVSSFNFGSLLVGDSFTYSQILKATRFLSDSNLIKHGHSGKFFYGVLQGGTEVVIKQVDVSCSENELCFMSELEICSMVYHSRLIPLLGHCLENGYQKFLVYKYTPNKDLGSLLGHDDTNQLPSLDWTTRLKIATGVAEGLCYLHHECFPPLVHRDIQASSILLDDDFEVRLGSLAGVCIEEKENNQIGIARFLRLPKISEQISPGKSTARRSYDVYCFGKILLELVTSKLGASAANDSITKEKDWMEKTLRYVVVSKDKKQHLTEVWAVAFIAKACVHHKPSKRPQMSEILEALKRVKSTRFGNQQLQAASHPNKLFPPPTMPAVPEGSKTIGRMSQATENAKSTASSTASGSYEFSEVNASKKVYPLGEILATPNLRIFTYSELKAATRNFEIDTLLGEGAYGRVYKGSLHEKSMSESGSEALIAVKEVYSWRIPAFRNRWQSEVDLHGRLSHPNIVKLLGYCWESKELFLVYEFMQEGSLASHLFGRRGSAFQPLTWEKRIKILVGAARGVAFLHQSQKRGSIRRKTGYEGFYDHFEPSKVLLDQSYNAKLSDFGQKTSLIDPDPYNEVHPKLLWREGKSSPMMDVYGFGILLVEMITGVEKLDTRCQTDQEVMLDWIKPDLSGQPLFGILDSKLERNYPVEAVTKVSQLALLCLEKNFKYRPSMEAVVKELELIESPTKKGGKLG
ncbi:uncharacterized protein [Coffea arabica]|uniref:non-specific serine/threonine protein kinase n=1 Tax=Coffea arabica TaxID=13443 RepID=A0A6P6T5B3_COFAR|nr:probable receptor-like protein kinase At2g42960 [Coffea arabica]